MPSEEGVEDGDPAAVIEPSPHQGAAPPEFEPLGTEAPGATHPKVSYEVPVGLINDVLLEEELCSKMLNSLKRVYNHHKVMLFLVICSGMIISTTVLLVTFLV